MEKTIRTENGDWLIDPGDQGTGQINPGDTVTSPSWGENQTAIVDRIETHASRCGNEDIAFFTDGGFWRVDALRKVDK